MIVFLTSFLKYESFSFAFSSVNANHSHSHSTSQMRIVLIRICISDPRPFLRLCANPTICQAKYYVRLLGYVQIRWKFIFTALGACANPILICANPIIIFRGKARSLLRRSGGREFGRVCANPMGIFEGGINGVNWGNSGMMGARGQIRENIMS